MNLEIHAGIVVVAVGVGNVLIFVADAPGAVTRRIEQIHSHLKIKREIKLRSAGNVHRHGPDGRDESGGGSDEGLEAVHATKIQLQSDGIYAAAIHRLAPIRAISDLARSRHADLVGILADGFDRDDVERVLQ